MWRFYLAVAVIWVLLSPPFLTRGACTEEFIQVEHALMEHRGHLRSADTSAAYFRSQAWPTSIITPERCREARPRFLTGCNSSTYVYAKVPVRNMICRVYRDSDVQVLLEYSDKGYLARYRTDMAPFRSLPLPFTKAAIDWGR